MDSSAHKDFLPHLFSHQSLHNTEHPTKKWDENGDLEQDQLKWRTCNDSLWSNCDMSGQSKGAYNSLGSKFNQSADSEQHSQKSQTLQEQYWACAIPNALPPRPDRDSPNWDPNKEYQDLLDYTYPLNSKYYMNKSNEETVTDGFLQDSGVDLGSYNLSCASKFDCFSSSYREDKLQTDSSSHTNVLKSPHAFSTPLFKRTGYRSLRNTSESSNLTSYGDLSPYGSKVDLAKESADSFCLPKYNVFDKLLTADRSTRAGLQKPGRFLASTSVLPLQKDVDSDEEYLSLPPSLKELDTLATHLKDLSLKVDQAGSTNCDQANACKQTLNLSGIDVNQELLDSLKSKTTDDDFKDLSYVCQLSTCQNHSDSEIKRFSSLRDMLDGGASSLVEMISCPSMSKLQESKSLVQRIQKFCLQLDKLIQWLYSVAEVTDNWTSPKPSMEGIQLSLSLYLKLKKDVAEQRTLANTILKDGESLVKCMVVNSSVLKDTLALISKQSGELERHTERLYASVLEAMDTITDKGLGRNSNPKQPVSLEMESS